MNSLSFEKILDQSVTQLTRELRTKPFADAKSFENRVREVILETDKEFINSSNLKPPSQLFPDIVIGEFGIEVKFTTSDTWRCIANSVFEGTRSQDVKFIYLIFGKAGGVPEVRWAKYDDSIMHVRTSHVPRFEIEIGATQPLFPKMGITYEIFCRLSEEEKMHYVRKYARGRLKKGERLWWLENASDSQHSLSLQAKLYTSLSQLEKRQLRAESVLLCPQVMKSSRSKNKYDDAVLYMLTYRGVLCHQARDLFSAGSVALRSDPTRGGNYLLRALKDIESEILIAASTLEDALFEEYWGKVVPKESRIEQWLIQADDYATGWKPSKELFQNN